MVCLPPTGEMTVEEDKKNSNAGTMTAAVNVTTG